MAIWCIQYIMHYYDYIIWYKLLHFITAFWWGWVRNKKYCMCTLVNIIYNVFKYLNLSVFKYKYFMYSSIQVFKYPNSACFVSAESEDWRVGSQQPTITSQLSSASNRKPAATNQQWSNTNKRRPATGGRRPLNNLTR